MIKIVIDCEGIEEVIELNTLDGIQLLRCISFFEKRIGGLEYSLKEKDVVISQLEDIIADKCGVLKAIANPKDGSIHKEISSCEIESAI